ncbi:hypothetical protein LBK6_03520 [Leptospira borgpetersenii serovar Hardjo]|nr:hypothetical protein LBK6_03520 [Leptospira borgpetersenii serovar Hardjo]TQE48484.1 hypothetical protein FFZ95_18180 [Leptospira borgpetersenii]AMX60702.1 hypothetical protein LBK9_03465 [Leptospira borgpetersenii serovar Hardjo]AMX63946.1 hypothetical protein LBK30_03505 [Leptospira borgpetersenii serovar Hardjo]AMX67187.1 hypothetical protein LBHA_03480 [Leptospira borgpetersenii serovar Hardjo]
MLIRTDPKIDLPISIQRTEDGRQRTETEELLHHGFRMQFVEIKKRTKEAALAKRTAFPVQRTETGNVLFRFRI